MVPTTHGFTSAMPSAGQHQHHRDQRDQRHRCAHRRQPRRSQRTQQKIRAAQNEVGERKRAAKSQAVGERAAEGREKPNQAAEKSGEAAGLLDGKIQRLVQVTRQRGERRVVRKALEKLADVGHPEGRLESGSEFRRGAVKNSNFLPVYRVRDDRRDCSGRNARALPIFASPSRVLNLQIWRRC